MSSYVHTGIFRTKSNIYNEAFFHFEPNQINFKQNLKNELNLIELPLRVPFFYNSPFRVKA